MNRSATFESSEKNDSLTREYECSESPARAEMCRVLLCLNASAIALIATLICLQPVRTHHTYFEYMASMMTLSMLVFAAEQLVERLIRKVKLEQLRDRLRENRSELDKLLGQNRWDEWKSLFEKSIRDDDREWPLEWRMALAEECGIETSFLALGMFAVWVLFHAANLLR
jgi:hypothetical protein